MCTAFCGLYSSQTEAADKKNERPNILWLTFEDTSAYEFGCYGNGDVHTPNADSLAARGIQFMNAWSVAPQSSAARSSLITGCYSSTYGMDIHPVPYDTPADIFFPQRLREAGYYCTNNSKTHYNSTTDNKSCWDECNNKASYNSTKRGKDQPFFAVYNTVTSHMGRIRTFHTDGRRDYTQEGIFPQQLTLPSYVPDLPEVRSDYAGHLEAVQDVDTWLGIFLKDLETRGLEDNTIIFFFSDHGGCVARGKGYLYESGLKVPMIAYFPPKWRHLANGAKGKENGLVNFTDLGPTVLSLAGVKPPKNMQGKALYGKFASKEKREKVQSVIQKYGYTPNALAQGLSNSKTRSIGLMIADIYSPFYSAVATECEKAADKAGYLLLMLTSLGDPELEKKQLMKLYLKLLKLLKQLHHLTL